MKNRTLLFLITFLHLTQIACQQKHFGHFCKVNAKQKNVIQLESKEIKAKEHTTINLENEATIIALASEDKLISLTPISYKDLNLKVGTISYNHQILVDTSKANTNQKGNKKLKIFDPKNNTAADIAILLSAFHFLSSIILANSGIALLNSPDDWASISSFFLIFGFGFIILYFAVKGLYNYLKDSKKKGLIFSSLAFLYATIVIWLFFMFLSLGVFL